MGLARKLREKLPNKQRKRHLKPSTKTLMAKSARMSSELSSVQSRGLIVSQMWNLMVMMMMVMMVTKHESRQIEFEYSEMFIVICSIEKICFTNPFYQKKKKKKKKKNSSGLIPRL